MDEKVLYEFLDKLTSEGILIHCDGTTKRITLDIYDCGKDFTFTLDEISDCEEASV